MISPGLPLNPLRGIKTIYNHLEINFGTGQRAHDVKTFCDEKAADVINIMTPQFGTINNAVEAVLYCKKSGVGAYVAGSCNETDISARVSAHIALATNAELVAAKPGMGVDEGIMIVYNEMQRALAMIAKRRR